MQRISTTVRLNRSVLQFDDAAYLRLERYLAESAGLLEGDPDPQEILGDLEQAVADQCSRRLQPGQSVVTLAELEPALAEIGSVQVPGAAPARAGIGVGFVAAVAASERGGGDQRGVRGARTLFRLQRHGAASLCGAAAAPFGRRRDDRVFLADAADAVRPAPSDGSHCAGCRRSVVHSWNSCARNSTWRRVDALRLSSALAA